MIEIFKKEGETPEINKNKIADFVKRILTKEAEFHPEMTPEEIDRLQNIITVAIVKALKKNDVTEGLNYLKESMGKFNEYVNDVFHDTLAHFQKEISERAENKK